ncbi:MAG: HRDC domain-containing protein [Spirochaetia bacterium]|nr:HRDC domain-containing protein [Spirochaetia bacterium]
MPYEIITLEFNQTTKTFNVDVLNEFCINKKVNLTKVEFFSNHGKNYWSVFIDYENILEKNGNETKNLTEAGKICFEKLREWRKETAEKEGIPHICSFMIRYMRNRLAYIGSLTKIYHKAVI